MNAVCSKCGTELTSSWSFCPHCGAARAHEAQKAATPPPHEKAPAPGAYGGLLYGVIVAPMLIIVGTLFCLTGLGLLIGIPIILAGVLAPLLGPLIGMGEHKRKCPACGTRLIGIVDARVHQCPACNRRLVVQGRKLVEAE